MRPEEILKLWHKYFNEKNISKIVNLYDKESILFPTFSDQMISDREKIEEYFFKVLIEEKVSVKIFFDSVKVKRYGVNFSLLSGNYIFIFNAKKKIQARFTFFISPSSNHPIKHHHSSRVPND